MKYYVLVNQDSMYEMVNVMGVFSSLEECEKAIKSLNQRGDEWWIEECELNNPMSQQKRYEVENGKVEK